VTCVKVTPQDSLGDIEENHESPDSQAAGTQ
jgi:hypothetical protein